MYRSLNSTVLSSWLQVLREWIEVVTLSAPAHQFFFTSFQVVLLLWCYWRFDWLPLNSTANLHTIKSALLLCDWEGGNICVIILVVATTLSSDQLCAKGYRHHMLCFLPIFATVNFCCCYADFPFLLLVFWCGWMLNSVVNCFCICKHCYGSWECILCC